ncbi:CAF17-like 4Fe-4S cluster assembly/insertion protein YgfZ [Tessaracoccus antarcticus]|uniref:Folate-binding protein n=1 Tax=Tessaracoccus antarcticus TaxID=2479848 RepID=A0A3M0GHQ6_9ACTN|nr:glycine cleavage T C-terminal barrel domain-containing protein [Tessaracoccus antarcticus]RMB61123.1 folate-binding protein [Tessaracoccus antarcticus]
MAVLLDDGIDAGLVWHHGNPVAEGRAIANGLGVADLGNRDVVEVRGPDRLTWLHALTTQHLESLAPAVATTALVLAPTGHIEHVLHGVDDGESFLAWTEPGRGAALVEWLDRMRFMSRVEVRLRGDLRMAWFGHKIAVPEGWTVRDSEIGGSDVFVPVDAVLPGDESSAVPVGVWAYEAARIAAGVPRIFVDTDHRTIPNEIGLLGTHLEKGCYRGQETVARVHTLGRPPRRLVQLHLDGSLSSLPDGGAPLMLDGRAVGFVGSSARHHELGPIALGLVKRNVPVDAQLLADDIPAAQEALVDPDVGLHVRPVLR